MNKKTALYLMIGGIAVSAYVSIHAPRAGGDSMAPSYCDCMGFSLSSANPTPGSSHFAGIEFRQRHKYRVSIVMAASANLPEICNPLEVREVSLH